jgi:hypothetical protein
MLGVAVFQRLTITHEQYSRLPTIWHYVSTVNVLKFVQLQGIDDVKELTEVKLGYPLEPEEVMSVSPF